MRGSPAGADGGAHRGAPARTAAQLLGAAEALREAIGSRMTPPERVDYDQQLALVGELLEDRARTLAWQQSCARCMVQVIELAFPLEGQVPEDGVAAS